MKLNRETGLYEFHASAKFATWVGGVLLSIVVGVSSYSMAVTRMYGQVTQDIALLRQEMTLRAAATDARLGQLEAGRAAVDALAAAVQANTEALRMMGARGGRQ